jgi:DNA-binding NarL/FixJ family response regulator
MHKIKVVLTDDHLIVRNGLRTLIEDEEDIEIVAEAGDGEEAIERVKSFQPDIIMLDITMPGMTGIQAAEVIGKQFPQTRMIMLSMHENEHYILKSVEAGAMGYLLKDSSQDEILKAIRVVAKGERYFNTEISGYIINGYLQKLQNPETIDKKEKDPLSKKEKLVLKELTQGMSSREIAEKLGLSIRTVDVHRANMMKKLKVKNAVELVRLALEQKLV